MLERNIGAAVNDSLKESLKREKERCKLSLVRTDVAGSLGGIARISHCIFRKLYYKKKERERGRERKKNEVNK